MASRSKSTFGFVLLIALAALGYLLITVPPKLVEQYNDAMQINAVVGYAYLAVVTVGCLLLFGLLTWGLLRLWKNTRSKERDSDRRSKKLSDLSAKERRSELQDNLASGREYAETIDHSPRLRGEIEAMAAELEAKRDSRRIEIVAFGTISSGKSSLLNALAGRDVFKSSVVGGTTVTRSSVPWPDSDEVVLVDTPGLAEVEGESRAVEAADAAQEADLVLFVVDGPLKSYEEELLQLLATMGKRILLCLNKEDWYDRHQQAELMDQLREQTTPAVKPEDVIAVRSREATRQQVRLLASGEETTVEVTDPPDISPLAKRMSDVVRREGGDLLLANLLMRSRGLVDDAKERVMVALDEEADRVINRYMWAAGGATAVNPIPLLDLAGGSALTVKMVLDLAGVYKQKIDADTVIEILAQLGKNLIAMLGASAAAPALAAAVGSALKTIPGIGTIAGGLLQGTVQALVTRWIGRIFCAYYRNQMEPPPGGIVELARREWNVVTSADEVRKLIRAGRERLGKQDDS